ncbi:MAG: hypothetical protein KZQ77_12580, partial [Candidatus Thiodiazotropha sp. (ex Notomyrtea botanica)]|nr:hypothetical protein [Candidatus Thiodiazotropha sp. (ex Notomyrtea botanica)]
QRGGKSQGRPQGRQKTQSRKSNPSSARNTARGNGNTKQKRAATGETGSDSKPPRKRVRRHTGEAQASSQHRRSRSASAREKPALLGGNSSED